MLTTPHATAGMAIGAYLVNPVMVIPAAIASHFLLDMVPHWQETLAPYIPTRKTYIRASLDICLAVGLTTLASHWQPEHTAVIWIGAFFANLPDFDSIVVLVPKLKRGIMHRFWDWHCKIQRETSSLLGVLPQLAVITGCLLLVKLG